MSEVSSHAALQIGDHFLPVTVRHAETQMSFRFANVGCGYEHTASRKHERSTIVQAAVNVCKIGAAVRVQVWQGLHHSCRFQGPGC